MTYYLSLVAYYIYFNSAKVAYLACLLALTLFYVVVLGSAGAGAPDSAAAAGWRFLDQQGIRNMVAFYLQFNDFSQSEVSSGNSNRTYYYGLPSAATGGGVAGY